MPFNRGGNKPTSNRNNNHNRINGQIRAASVRVIDENGEQLGVMSASEALAIADARELDLIEISATSTPPVCKIADYGKFRYEQQKRENLAKKNQHQQLLKEIRLHPRTDKHDVAFKLSHAKEFLTEGHKVKFTVIFKGREMAHQDIGRTLLQGILNEIKSDAKIDSPIKMEGRNMSLVVSPDKNKKQSD